jgi:Histidine kinase
MSLDPRMEPISRVWDSPPVTPAYRGRRALALAAMLVAVAIALPRFLTHTPYQRLGISLDWKEGQDFPRVEKVIGPPATGLLERGDVLVAMNGVRFHGFADTRQRIRKEGWPRAPVVMDVLRGNRELQVSIPPVQLGAWQRVRLFTFPVVAMIAAPLVAFLLVWRRPDLNAAWVFLWFAALQGVGTVWDTFRFTQFEPAGGFKAYLDSYNALLNFYPASFVHFMMVFPRPRWTKGRRRRSPWFWMVVAAYVVAAGLGVWMVAGPHPAGQDSSSPYLWFQSVALPIGALALMIRYLRRARDAWNPTLAERLLAIAVALVLLATTAVDALFQDPGMAALYTLPVVRLLVATLTLAWLCAPMVIALLIANDPVFDPRRLLVRSIPYALLSGVLAALYLGIVVVSQRVFAAATGEEAVVFNVVAALVVAFAFSPLRVRTQRALDRLYGRDPAALRRALDRAGQELLGALDRAEVRASVEHGLTSGLKRPVAVEWPDGELPRLARGEEVPEDAASAVANLLMQAGIRLENLALQEQRAAAERRAAELREAATRAELRALHAQVQPHFLFNALNALSYLTETDPPAAQRFTERLADMLRYTVQASQRPDARLSEEIAFVEDYLGVARERYESALQFEYHGARDLLAVRVPPLLLQPLVENSLKHGCAPGLDALHLSLVAEASDGWLTLVFKDDGAATPGRKPGLGVGLTNLEQRVQRFAGPEASVSARPVDGGGFAVTLRWRAALGEAA